VSQHNPTEDYRDGRRRYGGGLLHHPPGHDLLANDFGAIARAMQREAASPHAVLYFWDMLTLLTSTHESVEAAVTEAYALMASDTGVPFRITTTKGTLLMDSEALAEAVIRYGEVG
jgi:hypothetical protein